MTGHAQQRGRFLYYRCRRTFGAYVEGNCRSRYISKAIIEGVVREEVARVLGDPDRLLEEARRFAGTTNQDPHSTELERELRRVETEQGQLARLYTSGTLPEDILAAESKRLSARRQQLEGQRQAMLTEDSQQFDLAQLEQRLPEAAERVRAWVLAASVEDLALILDVLQLKVRANHNEAHIEGVIPFASCEIVDLQGQNYVTTARTSA